MPIRVDIVSAERELYSGEADMVFAPAEQGEVGIAPRHAPYLAKLVPGNVRVQLPGNAGMLHVYVSGGIIEVQPHQVSILSDTAIRAEDIDESAVLEARKHAEEMIANNSGLMEMATVQSMLAQTVAQLSVIQKWRNSRH